MLGHIWSGAADLVLFISQASYGVSDMTNDPGWAGFQLLREAWLNLN